MSNFFQTQNQTNSRVFISSANITLAKFLLKARTAIISLYGDLTETDKQALSICVDAIRDNISKVNAEVTNG